MEQPDPFTFQEALWCGDPAFAKYPPLDLPVKPGTPLEDHPLGLQNHLTFARCRLPVKTPPKKAVLRLTGDDHVRFYASDRLVVEGPCPSLPSRHPVMEVDLTPWLTVGENLLAVEVFYQGLINRVWNSGDRRQGFMCEITLDGAVVASTPGPWRTLRAKHVTGVPTGYLTQFTERWNAAAYPRGWRRPGFDDRDWVPLEPVPGRGHRFVPSPIPPVVHHTHAVMESGHLAPATVHSKTGPAGELRLDAGREMAGRVKLRADGPAGKTVTILYGEELNAEGLPKVPMRCGIDSRDELVLSGLGDDLYEAVDYKAFRHIAILPQPGVALRALEIEERHDPEPGPAVFRMPAPFERIWNICHRAVTVASQGVLVDCPSREKGQYLGDLTVSGHARLYATGDSALWRKALFDFADSTRLCPGIMAVAPGGFFQEIADFSLQYPWQLLTWYRFTGDGKTLRTLLPVARGILCHFAAFAREDGLLADVKPKWNLVDWPQNLRDGYDFRLDPGNPGPGVHAALNGHYLASVAHLAMLEDLAGVPRTHGPDFLPNLIGAFQKAFWQGDRMVDHPESSHASLHANALALWADAVPAEGIPAVVDLIKEKGLACGVQMSYFVLHALARHGERPHVWHLLTQSGEHSWMEMLKDGATSAFEAWGLDQKWNTSLCHPWAASPIPLFVEEIAGLKPGTPGWGEVHWNPLTSQGLPDYRLTLHLPGGPLTVSKKGGTFGLESPSDSEPRHVLLHGLRPDAGIHAAPSGRFLLKPGMVFKGTASTP